MGVAQKTKFSNSDHLAKFFGISGAPVEHNTAAKSKKTFLLEIRPFWHKRPRTNNTTFKLLYDSRQRRRKHFECGGCISTFFPIFWQFQKVGVYCVIKFGAVTKFGRSQNQCCHKIRYIVSYQLFNITQVFEQKFAVV